MDAYALNFVLLAAINVIHNNNLIGLLRVIDSDLYIGISLFLKKVDQVLLAFIDQITINRALRINWYQFPDLSCRKQRNTRKFCALRANRHNGTKFDLKRDDDTIIFWVEDRRTLLHRAR